jgi:GAF domain-containing protein
MHNGHQGVVGRTTLTASHARALLLEPQARTVFDRLAPVVARTMRATVATLGVVEGSRLVLVSQFAVPDPWSSARYLPLEATFCWHTAAQRAAFVVSDATRDAVGFSVTPLENSPRASYCGAPVMVEHEPVAVLSVTDAPPRQWSSEEVGAMRHLVDSVCASWNGWRHA